MTKKLYEEYEYEEIYNKKLKIKETSQDEIENKLRKNKNNRYTYVRKTIVSGNLVECEIYPVWKCKNDVPRVRVGESREAQKNLNEKNAKKKIVRLVNTNFSDDDLMITLTYEKNYLPKEEEAKRDIQNYISRLKRRRKKLGLDELKYLYVVEYENSPKSSKKIRVHHHIIINKMPRDVAEDAWGKGRTDSTRLQTDDFGLTGIAKYVSKGIIQGRRWGYSKNLKKPKITKSRTVLTFRKVESISNRPDEYKKFFEDQYSKQGYEYKECTPYMNEKIDGYYLYATLIKRREKE